MLKTLRVLLVEDSEDDALLLERELKRGGFEPAMERIQSSDELYHAVEQDRWDIVITDHNMPGFSSEAVLKIVNESELDVPVIIVSGSIGEEVAVAAMKLGAHDYIMKDNLNRLVPAIEREVRDAQVRHAHKQAEQTIIHMAYHDALTGLTNRHEFERRLQKAINISSKHSLTHALLYLDLDQFKIINDTCGHIAGDELLRQLAVVLRDPIREHDTLARLGGDEFGILLENCPLIFAEHIAERLLKIIQSFRFSWEDKVFTIGASIGLIEISPERNMTLAEVLSAADMACYVAKDMGRNRLHIYSEDDENLVRRHGDMEWVARLNKALEDNRFQMHCQNIISLSNHKPEYKSCEFLLRMVDENGELILPGAFIPAAERYNLMPCIDRWVINHVFEYLATWKKTNGDEHNGMFFINLSGTSLSDDKFFTYIHEHLREYKLPPEMFCFEITETAAITNLHNSMEFIQEIRNAGCHFALDDFGTGVSSFSYLKTLPVDYLKIDGSFISKMLNDPMNIAIVESINRIGHVAGLKTIAEFVESLETQNKLREIGVDLAQGYAIQRPQPLPELG